MLHTIIVWLDKHFCIAQFQVQTLQFFGCASTFTLHGCNIGSERLFDLISSIVLINSPLRCFNDCPALAVATCRFANKIHLSSSSSRRAIMITTMMLFSGCQSLSRPGLVHSGPRWDMASGSASLPLLYVLVAFRRTHSRQASDRGDSALMDKAFVLECTHANRTGATAL